MRPVHGCVSLAAASLLTSKFELPPAPSPETMPDQGPVFKEMPDQA